MRPLVLLGYQVRYEQMIFWRNRIAAFITLGFPLLALFVTGAVVNNAGQGANSAAARNTALAVLVAFTVMSATFNATANTLVARRQLGQLKRLRGTPVPAWIVVLGLLCSTAITALAQAAALILIAPVMGASLPRQPFTPILIIAAGALVFGAIAVAATASVTRMEVAGPVVGIGFMALLFLSGAIVPLPKGSLLADLTGLLPLRPFREALGESLLTGGLDTGALLLLVLWAVVATAFAARRFRWTATG